jgi:MFS superfamily sulfate permease-like transporter
MRFTDEGRPGPGWMRDSLAGCTGAVAVLPVVVTLGLLACAPMGAAAPQAALKAAFLTVGVGGLAHALLSRTSLPVSGLSSPTALTMAALVADLLSDPQLSPATPSGLQGILALMGLSLLFSGALQVAMAGLGLARLVRAVPQPVLAGFMNSAALLVVLAQLPLLLDLPVGARPGLNLTSLPQWMALALGLGTAGTVWLLAHFRPRLPAALLALVAGTAVHALLAAWSRSPPAGSTLGSLPPAWPWPPALLPLLSSAGGELVLAHAGSMAFTAFALASVGALESSLNVRAIDQLLNTRHDPRRELVALGCANMICGLIGGLPLAATRTRALATLQAGGRGRVAALVGPTALLVMYALGGPLLAMLPLPALAGVMLIVAVGLADRWTGRMIKRWWAGHRSRDLNLGLGVVALVVGTALWRGMAAGVGLGVLLSMVVFAARMNRALVRDRYRASARPSRRVYPTAVEARLQPLRDGITVFELDGALFFGTCEQLLDETDALGAECRCLVLDLSRVGSIDESGAMALQLMRARLEARGIRVKLAGLTEASHAAQALRSFGVELPLWPDADRAIEAAEHHVLAQDGNAGDVRAMAEVPLASSSLLEGLDDAGVAAVVAHLQPRRLQAGEVLFSQGDPADRLYVVSQGSVSAISLPDRAGHTLRYISVSPGMTIGETAMLDGGGRSAGAFADAPSVVHALTLQAMEEIGRTHPAVAIRLHRNLAVHLAQRLRGAAGARPPAVADDGRARPKGPESST